MMNKQTFPKIKETLYTEKLKNGLSVFLLPKKGFHKSYASISTNLGSLATKIKDQNQKEYLLPKGIAHFLEHKLFEQNNADVSTLFAANQARVNAFTQNNRTTYLFSCTANLEKNLALLLNFVQFPLFTKDGVEKEKGIITQEIRMYKDDPNTTAYMSLLKNMYQNHPIIDDILGTEATIKEINVDILTKTHQAFYNPHQMILFIAGNFDPENLMAFIRDNQEKVIFDNGYFDGTVLPLESDTVITKESTINLEITIPNYLLAIKQLPTDYKKENVLKKELIMAILTDIVIGKSSANYKHLLKNGLINDSFGQDITFEETYGFYLIGSETYKPKELATTLKAIFQNLNSFTITLEAFQRTKRQIIGGFIQALNSLEYIANQFTKYHYLNTSLFSILDIANEITIDDINAAKKYFSNPAAYSSITALPKK